MSDNALVVVQPGALTTGGIGLDRWLEKLKPAHIEIVQNSTRQEGAQPGKFRVTSTNEHFDELQIVVFDAWKRREYYADKKNFSAENKHCFSLDNVRPHPKAKNPPKIGVISGCAACPMGDIRWEKWRETKDPADLPLCRSYYHTLIGDRQTQLPYYLDLKGLSVGPFEQAMEQVARLLVKYKANILAENKAIAKANAELPDGAERTPLKPMPNIFDVTFTAKIRKEGNAHVFYGTDFKVMSESGRQEFGQLYINLTQRRVDAEKAAADAAAAQAQETVANAAVSGEPIEGEYVNNDTDIVI